MNSTSADLAGRRALVSGGARGIGAACVRRYAGKAAQLAEEVGGDSLVADLTDERAIAVLGIDVDILVNNAGIQHVAPVPEFPPEIFTRILALMLQAPFLLSRAALPTGYVRTALVEGQIDARASVRNMSIAVDGGATAR